MNRSGALCQLCVLGSAAIPGADSPFPLCIPTLTYLIRYTDCAQSVNCKLATKLLKFVLHISLMANNASAELNELFLTHTRLYNVHASANQLDVS